MKIIYYVDGRMPSEKANGYQSAQMCQAFIEEECEVTLLTPSRKKVFVQGIQSNTSLKEYYNLRVNISSKRLPSIDFIHLLQTKLHFSDENVITKLGSVLTSYSAAFSLAYYLRKEKSDVIYLRSIHALVSLLLFLPKTLYSKVFFELHNLPKRKSTLDKLIKVFLKIGGVVTVTEHLKKSLIEKGLREDKTIVAHDAVDFDSFNLDISKDSARKYVGIDNDYTIAAFIGKYHTNGQEKGIPEIIKASKYLITEKPDIYFYFVGGPQDRIKAYEEIIAEESLPRERFIFIDKQPVQKVPYYLKASDVLLMPHPWSEFYAYHVSPLKLFEYMASKRPIVASKLPAISEILRNKENALLGEPGNPKSIAENIRTILYDRDLSSKISEQAYLDVQQYTWSKRAKKIIAHITGERE